MCKSVGWLLHDGEDCKIIIPHATTEKHDQAIQQGCEEMTIPASAILKIVRFANVPT